ncbi:MAG: hypothetical protein RL094_747 [Candidatus Parcubacteria bacterium]|jgi:dephospho-CoA kinase
MFYSKAHALGRVKNIIGVCGLSASGKTTAAKLLSEKLKLFRYSLGQTKREEILAEEERSAIVEDIQRFADIEYFREHANFVLIYIKTIDQVRFTRWTQKRGFIENLTKEEFLKRENESERKDKNVASEVIDAADYTIENSGSETDLEKAIEDLVGKMDPRKLR